MPSGDEYRRKALGLRSKANQESRPEVRNEFQALAMAYMRLAEMADRRTLSLGNPSSKMPAESVKAPLWRPFS
jgi:hypothetical protein